jgi:uncharacterized protein YjlB
MSVEGIKKYLEKLTGYRRPGRKELGALKVRHKPVSNRFRDDGETPNNPKLPLLIFRGVLTLPEAFDPAAVFEEAFAANGWGNSWRDSIYPFLHFHTATHEVLGIARGTARVRFGGRRGRALAVKAGDVIVLPAGTGHQRLSPERELLVVGAYPRGGKYDEPKPEDVDHEEAVARIAKVRLPSCDPVFGRDGPLKKLWRHKRDRAKR